jgi:hypothetical protein
MPFGRHELDVNASVALALGKWAGRCLLIAHERECSGCVLKKKKTRTIVDLAIARSTLQ